MKHLPLRRQHRDQGMLLRTDIYASTVGTNSPSTERTDETARNSASSRTITGLLVPRLQIKVAECLPSSISPLTAGRNLRIIGMGWKGRLHRWLLGKNSVHFPAPPDDQNIQVDVNICIDAVFMSRNDQRVHIQSFEL